MSQWTTLPGRLSQDDSAGSGDVEGRDELSSQTSVNAGKLKRKAPNQPSLHSQQPAQVRKISRDTRSIHTSAVVDRPTPHLVLKAPKKRINKRPSLNQSSGSSHLPMQADSPVSTRQLSAQHTSTRTTNRDNYPPTASGAKSRKSRATRSPSPEFPNSITQLLRESQATTTQPARGKHSAITSASQGKTTDYIIISDSEEDEGPEIRTTSRVPSVSNIAQTRSPSVRSYGDPIVISSDDDEELYTSTTSPTPPPHRPNVATPGPATAIGSTPANTERNQLTQGLPSKKSVFAGRDRPIVTSWRTAPTPARNTGTQNTTTSQADEQSTSRLRGAHPRPPYKPRTQPLASIGKRKSVLPRSSSGTQGYELDFPPLFSQPPKPAPVDMRHSASSSPSRPSAVSAERDYASTEGQLHEAISTLLSRSPSPTLTRNQTSSPVSGSERYIGVDKGETRSFSGAFPFTSLSSQEIIDLTTSDDEVEGRPPSLATMPSGPLDSGDTSLALDTAHKHHRHASGPDSTMPFNPPPRQSLPLRSSSASSSSIIGDMANMHMDKYLEDEVDSTALPNSENVRTNESVDGEVQDTHPAQTAEDLSIGHALRRTQHIIHTSRSRSLSGNMSPPWSDLDGEYRIMRNRRASLLLERDGLPLPRPQLSITAFPGPTHALRTRKPQRRLDESLTSDARTSVFQTPSLEKAVTRFPDSMDPLPSDELPQSAVSTSSSKTVLVPNQGYNGSPETPNLRDADPSGRLHSSSTSPGTPSSLADEDIAKKASFSPGFREKSSTTSFEDSPPAEHDGSSTLGVVHPREDVSEGQDSTVASRLVSQQPSSATSDRDASTDYDEPKMSPLPDDSGLEVITYEMQRLMLRPKSYRRVKEVPAGIHTYMSTIQPIYLKMPNTKLIFETMMMEVSSRDEPNAPSIQVYNEVDDEAAPPFEFLYSNEMWYDEDIPPPDYDHVKGCGCEGVCDPSNSNCSCVRRQEMWSGPKGYNFSLGFAYDEHGRLKDFRDSSMPVFECNWKCGCDDDCPNRVVQRGRKININLYKYKHKGWGVVNGSVALPKGTFVGIYAGEVLTSTTGDERGKIYDKTNRTYLFDIDFWHLHDSTAYKKAAVHHMPLKRSNKTRNKDWDPLYCVDAMRVGNFTRFLNHSCDPNCIINAVYINDSDFNKPLFCIFTRKTVAKWEELCFSYHGLDEHDTSELPATNPAKGGARYAKCMCGEAKCQGVMFS